MAMISLILLYICLIICAWAENNIISSKFVKQEKFGSFTCKAGDSVVSLDHARSVLNCIRVCSRHETCKAAFYDKVNFTCHGCGSTYAAKDVTLLPPLPESVYYRKDACTISWIRNGQSFYGGDFSNAVINADAKRFCDDCGAHMVVIDTKEEQAFVKQLASQSIDATKIEEYPKGVWIGMHLISPTWIITHSQLAAAFLYWGDGEPNGGSTSEFCATAFYEHDWKWADTPCTEYKQYTLCERDD